MPKAYANGLVEQNEEWLTGEAMASIVCERRPNRIEGVLGAAGVNNLLSDAKDGKSTLALEMVRSVTTGGLFLGRFPTVQGPAIYWQADDTNRERFIRNYQEIVSAHGGQPFPNFEALVKRQALNPDGITALQNRITATGAVLVVVDCWTAIRGPKAQDWVAQEYSELRMLSELGAKHNTAIVLLHHLASGRRANGTTNPFIGAAGSFAVGGSVDGQIALARFSTTRTERVVSLNGRDVDALRFVYGRGLDRRLFFIAGGDLAEQWDDALRLYRAIREGSFNGKAVGEALGISDRQGRAKIARLRCAGAVEEINGRQFCWSDDFERIATQVTAINGTREGGE